jgi:hypothetical protein
LRRLGWAIVLLLVWSGAASGAGAFDRARDSAILDLVAPDSREDLASALEDAGANWTELAAAIRDLEGRERDACVWLILGMPHIDRLEMKATTLTEHVRYAFRALDGMPYEVPADMFEPYILTYRIEDEPVDAWRAALFDRYAPLAEREGTIGATARKLNEDLARSLESREPDFFGPHQSPLMTLRSGSGTSAEISILACAALKSVGIPSREAGVPVLGEEDGGASWVEFYDGGRWRPLYPLKPNAFGDTRFLERGHPTNITVVETRSAFENVLATGSYTDTGTIEMFFVADGEPAAGFEHFSVNVLNEGALAPLDPLEAVADQDGRFQAIVGDGTYVVEAGVRDPLGNPSVTMREVTVRPGAAVTLAFDVSVGREIPGLDPETLAGLGPVVTVLVLLDPKGEPSLRMLPLITGSLRRYRANVRLVAAVGKDERSGPILPLLDGDGEVVTYDELAHLVDELPGAPVLDPDAPRPVVEVYAVPNRRSLLLSDGYDLNIGRQIEDALVRYLGRLASREGIKAGGTQ